MTFSRNFDIIHLLLVIRRVDSMSDCAFCRIIRGELPAEVLYSNDHVFAILDINPIHFGHVLVIPKVHCVTFLELPESELPEMIRATQLVAKAIVKTFEPQGFNIFSNNGVAAGQSVFHVHFHVTPRYTDDQIRFVLKLKKYEGSDMAAYGSKLRDYIRSTSHQNH